MNSIIESRNIGRNFTLGEFSIVRECVTVGDDTEVREYCVIGCLPMAFADGKRLTPTGVVVIGSNVFINSHCDVVRALTGSTIIEKALAGDWSIVESFSGKVQLMRKRKDSNIPYPTRDGDK